MLLVLTWRTEDVPLGHRLRRLATELSRAGAATAVRLGRLGEGDVTLLVRAVRPEGGSELEQRVYRETEGLPVFLTEYLAAIEAGGEPAAGDVPREMRDLVDARVAALGAIARQLLETAAVIGRSFSLEMVRGASGRSEEEAADGLDELVAQRTGARPRDPGARLRLRPREAACVRL